MKKETGRFLGSIGMQVLLLTIAFLLIQGISVDIIDGLVASFIETGASTGITTINFILWILVISLIAAFVISTFLIQDDRKVSIPLLSSIATGISIWYCLMTFFLISRPDVDYQLALVPAQFVVYIATDPNLSIMVLGIAFISSFVIFYLVINNV